MLILNGQITPVSQQKLQRVKVTLLLLIMAFIVVKKKFTTWPIVTWPMYSDWQPEFPSNTKSVVQLEVISKTGETYRFLAADLLSMERTNIVESLREKAFDKNNIQQQNVYRQALLQLIQDKLPGVEIKTIQQWQITWEVSPMNLPPLQRNQPKAQVIIGSFDVHP